MRTAQKVALRLPAPRALYSGMPLEFLKELFKSSI
jgi:hypothetical protein